MDFCINYFVSFLLENHISLVTGFFLWHSIVFVCTSLILILAVYVYSKAEQQLKKLFPVLNTNSEKQVSEDDNAYDMQNKYMAIVALASIIFMWQVLPLSTSFLSIKTDTGVLLFLAFMFIPLLYLIDSIPLYKNADLIKTALNSFFKSVSMFIPFILSVLSAVIISGTLAFGNIQIIQNSHGIASWFCFPAIIGIIVIIFTLAEAYSDKKGSDDKKQALFQFTEKAYFFVVSAFTVNLFFGGYMPPFPFFIANLYEHSPFLYGLVLSSEQVLWLIIKTYLLFTVIMVVKNICLVKINEKIKREEWQKHLFMLSVINFIAVCIITVKFGDFYVL